MVVICDRGNFTSDEEDHFIDIANEERGRLDWMESDLTPSLGQAI